MSEAIMVLSEENLWSRIISRHAGNHFHWYLQCLGTSFNIAGIVVLFKSRETHFKSIHGILGISSAAILSFLSLSGFTVLFSVKLNNLMRPIVSKCIHNFLGITCYILGMIALCYGYRKKWILKYTGVGLVNLGTVITGIIIFITIMRPVRSLVNQIKSISY
ncbi:hypothetical protein PV326_013710 [Microctonus aethiopoides]|nr:hypothetical protein PV326_013710 [Microctonus aethiopoides]